MRKIIIVCLIISLLLMTNLYNIAESETTIYCLGGGGVNDTSFDGVASGLDDYSGANSNYMSFDNVGTVDSFETSTSGFLSSPNSLKLKLNGATLKGYCNLTSSFDYIGIINISFIIQTRYGINVKLYDAEGNNVIYFQICTSGLNNLYWTDISSGSKTIGSLSASTRYYLIITHNNTNRFHIELKDSTFAVLYDDDYAGNYAEDYTTFSYMYIYGDNGNNEIYFDNFYIDTSGEGETETIQEFCNGIPTAFLTDSLFKGQRFIESKYTDWTGLGITGTITEVQFPIDINQLDYVSNDLSDYKLRVNGIYFGDADNISEYDDYYGCYWLIWDTYSIDVKNDFPVFSFWVDANPYMQWYWYRIPNWACSLYPFKYHNTTNQWKNTVFDGTSYMDADCDYDLAYCFTVESFEYGEPEPPETPDEFIITNLYFNFYDAETGTKLQMIELSKALTYASLPYFPYEDSYAELLLTLTAMSDGGDETHIYMPVGQEPPYLYSYLSSQPVVYNGVTIAPYGNNTIDFMGGSLGNIAGKVDGKNVLWNRYTVVQEVQPFGDYDIYLIRYGEDNWTEPLPDPVPWENEYGDFFIEFYDENPDKVVECYYRLGGKQPVLIYQVNDTLFGTYANGYLWEMTDSTGKKLQEGQIIFSSGEKNGFIPVPYVFTKEGYYQIHLYNMTVGSLKNDEVYRGEDVYVCKKTGGGGGGGTGTTPVDFIFVNLGGSALGSIVGMIITIFSLLIPFMVARGMNINGIPMFVYAITGGMGIAISSILGLFPPWLPFFIIALGIIIAVIVYIYRGGSGGE